MHTIWQNKSVSVRFSESCYLKTNEKSDKDIWSKSLDSTHACTHVHLIMNRHVQHTHSMYMYRVTHSGRTLAILNIFLQCFLRWLHTDLVIFSNAYSVWRFDLHTKRIQLKSDDIFKYYITCLFRNCLSLSKYQILMWPTKFLPTKRIIQNSYCALAWTCWKSNR